VTNNQDPDGLGRVKVKLPWLSEEIESHWARVVTPMAGKGYGVYFLPEVDDEVLVAFEHGVMEFPYVLGALWNGKDTPPVSNEDGKNNLRTIKSRNGHVITLDDTEGQEKIIIRDKTGKNALVIDSAQNTLTIQVEGDLTLTTQGKITLKSGGGDLALEGRNISLQAQQNCDIQANQSCTVQATAGMALKCVAGVNINNGALEVM
jgi:uncharacterized protein involved in type VI secretion and phage assembly